MITEFYRRKFQLTPVWRCKKTCLTGLMSNVQDFFLDEDLNASGRNRLHHAGHTAHASHTTHAAAHAGHGVSGGSVFLDLGDDSLGRRQE